jgi:hypothetical protein
MQGLHRGAALQARARIRSTAIRDSGPVLASGNGRAQASPDCLPVGNRPWARELLRRAQALGRILLTVDQPDVRDADGIRQGLMPAPIDGEQYHFDQPDWRRAYAAGMDDMLAWVRGLLLCATPAFGVDMDRLEREYRHGTRGR